MIRFHQWIAAAIVIAVLACVSGAASMSETKGTIAALRPERSEFVLTETFKDLTFQLTGNTTILINGSSAKLADLRVGDSAAVAFERQGRTLHAIGVRVKRNVSWRPVQSEITPVAGPPRWETRATAGSSK